MKILEKLKSKFSLLVFFFKRTHIKAVHEEDLIPLLVSLGIHTAIENGEFMCVYCDKKITIDNLWGISRIDKKFNIICSNPECVLRLGEE